MENKYKPGGAMDGVVGSHVKVVERSASRLRSFDVALRVLVFTLTLVVVVVVAVNKESKIISLTITQALPTVHIPATAKWQYTSAFVYFLVSNAIACTYALASAAANFVAAWSMEGKLALAITISDLTMVGLLFSANGAAAAVGVIGQKGNSHAHWNKVCNMFDRFCHHMAAGVVLSLLGSFLFLWLVVLSVFNLHRKSS